VPGDARDGEVHVAGHGVAPQCLIGLILGGNRGLSPIIEVGGGLAPCRAPSWVVLRTVPILYRNRFNFFYLIQIIRTD